MFDGVKSGGVGTPPPEMVVWTSLDWIQNLHDDDGTSRVSTEAKWRDQYLKEEEVVVVVIVNPCGSVGFTLPMTPLL